MTMGNDLVERLLKVIDLLAAEDVRQSKIHDLLETIREQIRLEVKPECRPDGLFTNIQNAVYAMRGRTRLLDDVAIVEPPTEAADRIQALEAELARKTEALEDARHEVWNLGLVVGQIAKWPRTYFNRFYVEEWAIRTAYILSQWDNGTSRALDVLNVTSQRTKPNKRLAEEARLRAARSALEEKTDV